MPLVMLRPNWPGTEFQRTVTLGDKKKQEKRALRFNKTSPTDVSAAEFKALSRDIGNSLFEVIYDEKNRVRYVESEEEADAPPDASGKEKAAKKEGKEKAEGDEKEKTPEGGKKEE